MATIEYSVAGQQIVVTKDEKLVENTIGVYTVGFTFDAASWGDFTQKTAVFVHEDYPDTPPYEVPIDDGEAPIPAAVLKYGNIMIGVYGSTQTQQYPTIWAPAKRVWPGAGPGVEPPEDPAFGMVVRTAPQELTEEQQEIARTNIGAAPKVVPDSTPGNITVIGSNRNIVDSGVSKDNLLIAPQLASNNIKTDSIPYKYRQTGGGIGVGNREYDSIVGGSVVHQQLVQYGAGSQTINGVPISFSDTGVITGSGTANNTGTSSVSSARIKAVAPTNHVLYMFANLISGTYNEDMFWFGNANTTFTVNQPKIIKLSTIASQQMYMRFTNGIAYTFAISVSMIDLTQRFGPAVADRLLAMETASAGSGIAVLNAMGLNKYRPYTATPSLESVSGLQEHKTVGFNLWDEDWVNGAISSAGGNIQKANSVRSNFVRVIPNATYYFKTADNSSSHNVAVYVYDENQNWISPRYICTATSANNPITMPSNARYVKFYWETNLATGVYDHTFCMNLSDPARNGTYEPYEEYTYPLDDSLTLRGVAILDDNQNIKFDGDTYAPDGTVTRKRGIVDLGTLTWTNYKTDGFYANIADAKKSTSVINNLISSLGLTSMLASASLTDHQCSFTGNPTRMYIVISGSGTDPVAFKTQMSGQMLDYELDTASQTTETAEPYDAVQICDPLGTEEYVTTGIVPVGHITQYPENQVAKLDGLPSDFSTLIAPTEKTYTATRNYTANRLLIVNNILYKATANISSGATLTVGTNITATTLDEVIASL